MNVLLPPDEALTFMRTNLGLFQQICAAVRPRIVGGDFVFYCEVCSAIRPAVRSDNWNLRNGVQCAGCYTDGRHRHVFAVLRRLLVERELSERMILEEVTPFRKLIESRLGPFNGSEYFGADKTPGVAYEFKGRMVVHEDMCALSRRDESVDLIVHLDVLEHIPDMARGLNECFRVLRPGGHLLMTVPFYDNRNTVQRALISDGKVVNVLPPSFHGNPIDGNGTLVFNEPGIDLLSSISAANWGIEMSLGADVALGLLPDGHPQAEHHCWNLVFRLTKQ